MVDEYDIRRVIDKVRAERGPGCIGQLVLLVGVLIWLAILFDVLASANPRVRRDASGQAFLCWPRYVDGVRQPIFPNLREIDGPEYCVAVDHQR